MPFTKQIWGSPVKKQKRSQPKVTKRGNPGGVTWQTWEKCKVCEEPKRPPDVDLKHHGSRCHWCFTKIQFFARKFGKKKAMDSFTELQLGHIKAESLAARKAALETEL